MAYNAKTDWTLDDDVTETDFNRIEQGIAGVEDEATQLASETQDGRMSSEDYSKLAGIEAEAEANDVDSVNGQTGAVSLAKGDVGLSDVTNDQQATKAEFDAHSS
ncbi:hypothetical protein D7Z54_33625, partial [Salibacterium salarium]